jgi:hypothetical protein
VVHPVHDDVRGDAVSGDLTARVAGLAAAIEAGLAEDEAAAKAWERAPWPEPGESAMHWRPVGKRCVRYDNGRDEPLQAIDVSGRVALYAEAIWVKWDATGERAVHVARNDPARALRHVKATRDLVAEILAERHDYNVGDEFYSCSQAVEYGTDGEPGSGCSDQERAGKPCDCGRDERVARMLGIIATEWGE